MKKHRSPGGRALEDRRFRHRIVPDKRLSHMRKWQQENADDFFDKKQVRLHIYRLPNELSADYCFGGGNPISFLNVDFFDVPWDIERAEIRKFVGGKRYFNNTARFLVLATPEYPTLTFTIEPSGGGCE